MKEYCSSELDYFNNIAEINQNQEISVKEKYAQLYIVFVNIIEDKTQHCRISFSGTFPRMAYICKECNFSDTEIYHLNTVRIHCNKVNRNDMTPTEEDLLYDIKALADSIAKIYNLSIPDNLKKILPVSNRAISIYNYTSNINLRVTVSTWDENYMTGYTEDENSALIKIDYRKYAHNNDLDYITNLLTENCQLYLLNIKIDEHRFFCPDQIIYEPDYLIEISAIARCWKEYGHHPYNYLLEKITPARNTSAMLLGNLAGQFLDETINTQQKDTDYNNSIKRFFTKSALKIITCKDDLREFHSQAKEQMKNIRNFVQELFPYIHNIERDKLILEPSFVCEKLGIQGRVDLLQDDYKVLMEQKSGKRDFYSNGHKEEHYIQILLYRLLLSYNFNIKSKDSEQYLLYSKYPDGLMLEGSSDPNLIREILKLRNQIVKCDLLYAEGAVKQTLTNLTPEQLNINSKSDNLWKKFQLPQIQQILDIYKNTSYLEKSYFSRLFTFISKEHQLAKIGNSSKNRGFSGIWRCEVSEKESTGDILTELDLVKKEESGTYGGFDTITFSVPTQDDNLLPNFRTGDIVLFYSYAKGKIPDARTTKILRGTIKSISYTEVTIRLQSPQRNECIFPENKKWAIEHDFWESSYSSIYQALFAFLSADQKRKNLLLNQCLPTRDINKTLNGNYDSGKVSLNDVILKAKQANEYFLLIGPPGTGKTSYALVSMVKEALSESASILLAAYTNRAVDEICDKMQKHKIPYIRIGSELSCEERFRENLLDEKIKSTPNADTLRQIIQKNQVFIGTTTSISGKLNLFDIKHFDLAIIDEASQILEPHLLGIFCAKHENRNAIDKFIFIGDQKQLPAVVLQSEQESFVTDSELQEICMTNCRNSLFERLIKIQKKNNSNDFIHILCKQGRMHPEISHFSNYTFYEAKLQPIPVEHQQEPLSYSSYDKSDGLQTLIATRRLAFIASNGDENPASDKSNKDEALRVAALLRTIYITTRNTFGTNTVGVIVPYRNQIAMIRKEIKKLEIPSLMNITIDTVERYQGNERDFIIYSFTVQKKYQLRFLTENVFEEDGQIIDRKLNVALTRARKQMFLIGNPYILSQDITFHKLIKFIRNRHGFFNIPTENFVQGNFLCPIDDNIISL
ncbi:AAA domain-containing protein [Coprobacter sp.]